MRTSIAAFYVLERRQVFKIKSEVLFLRFGVLFRASEASNDRSHLMVRNK